MADFFSMSYLEFDCITIKWIHWISRYCILECHSVSFFSGSVQHIYVFLCFYSVEDLLPRRIFSVSYVLANVGHSVAERSCNKICFLSSYMPSMEQEQLNVQYEWSAEVTWKIKLWWCPHVVMIIIWIPYHDNLLVLLDYTPAWWCGDVKCVLVCVVLVNFVWSKCFSHHQINPNDFMLHICIQRGFM